MKPPTIDELKRIRDRFDLVLIRSGHVMQNPLAADKNYMIGGMYVKAEELVRRLARRCLELESFIGRDEELPQELRRHVPGPDGLCAGCVRVPSYMGRARE
jgi:hypothetical protein